MVKRVRRAVFPVGGLGTSFLPATKAMPKEMLPVVDKPLIQYAVEEAQAAGIEHFIFVTGRGKTVLQDHFDLAPELERVLKDRAQVDAIQALRSFIPESGQLSFTRQSDALGLGHAIWCARELVGDEPFAVILPDDLILSQTPCLKQMLDFHMETGGNVVAVSEVPSDKVSSYGMLDVEEDQGRLIKIKGLVEKPRLGTAPSALGITGRYILHPDIFSYLETWVQTAAHDITLTDAIADMMGSVPVHGLRYEGQRFDCGDRIGFVMANLAFALERPSMKDSVLQALDSVGLQLK